MPNADCWVRRTNSFFPTFNRGWLFLHVRSCASTCTRRWTGLSLNAALCSVTFFCCDPSQSQNATKVYIRNRLSKYLIISCLSSLNDDNIVTPIRKWPQMWCWSISIDRQIIVVVLSVRHCPGPMHEGLNREWMWLDFQSPSLNSHAGNTNSSI